MIKKRNKQNKWYNDPKLFSHNYSDGCCCDDCSIRFQAVFFGIKSKAGFLRKYKKADKND